MTIRSTVNVLEKTIIRDPATKSRTIELTETGDPITGDNITNREYHESEWDALTPIERNSPVHSHHWWDGTNIKR